jgi:hypothetical protein
LIRAPNSSCHWTIQFDHNGFEMHIHRWIRCNDKMGSLLLGNHGMRRAHSNNPEAQIWPDVGWSSSTGEPIFGPVVLGRKAHIRTHRPLRVKVSIEREEAWLRAAIS